MYKLTNTAVCSPAAEKLREGALQLLSDMADGLTFDEAEHRYFLGERELKCVSDVVEWFAPFDTLSVAQKCSVNPRHPLFGQDPAEIIRLWEEKRDAAAAAGTAVHAFGEACFLFCTGRPSEIAEEFKDRFNPDEMSLTALTPKEEAVARWWDSLDLGRYIPIAKETRVVNPAAGYAGTFDILFYDLYEEVFVIRDYKTNEDIHKGSYGQRLKAPLNILDASDIGKYTVQQNLYRIPMTDIGMKMGGMSLVWLREDGQFEEIPLSIYDQLIRFAIINLKNQIFS